MLQLKNKKGQFQSYLVFVVMLFIIGVFLLFANTLTNSLYNSFDEYFEDSDKYNNTEVHETVKDIRDIENSAWDYAFLAIFIGYIIQLFMLSFASKINIAFFWILVVINIPVLIVGVLLSNVWQEMATNTEFAETILRFPITNTILGTYFPIAIIVVIFFAMIAMFGKLPGGEK